MKGRVLKYSSQTPLSLTLSLKGRGNYSATPMQSIEDFFD
jgi:hypothetical protein